MKLWNFRGEQNNISEALQLKLPGRACISITGAGGKTSLIFAWARELALTGKRVGITTTTHMMSPERMKKEPADLYEGIRMIEAASAANYVCDEIDKAFAAGDTAFVFAPSDGKPDKVTMPSEEVFEHLREASDILLIEADGARRMPLKWPQEWEPVVPDHTDVTVCVAGLSALGRAPERALYGYEKLPEAYLKAAYDPSCIDEGLMRSVISSLDGGRKGARGDFRIFMNQADNSDLLVSAEKMQRELSVMGIQCAWGMLREPSDLYDAAEENSDAKEAGHKKRIAIILEAAGNSTRFGSNKLMHLLDDGRPMITKILDAVNELAIQGGANEENGPEQGTEMKCSVRPILVTQYGEITDLVKDAYGAGEPADPDADKERKICPGNDKNRFLTVINRYPDLGISHSMQLGIEAAGDADAFMFCVCDQPGITADTLRRLIKVYITENKKGTADIVSLAWQGRMCNPKIFSAGLKDELMSLSGDTGGRQIIAAHSDRIVMVEALSEDEVKDIDIPY